MALRNAPADKKPAMRERIAQCKSLTDKIRIKVLQIEKSARSKEELLGGQEEPVYVDMQV